MFYEEMSSTPEPSPVVKARMHRANKFSRMRKPSRGLTETLKAQARKRKRRR